MVEAKVERRTNVPLEERVAAAAQKALENKAGFTKVQGLSSLKKWGEMWPDTNDDLRSEVEQILGSSSPRSGYFHRHVAAAVDELLHKMRLTSKLTTNLVERSTKGYSDPSGILDTRYDSRQFAALLIYRRDSLTGWQRQAKHGFITTIK